MPASSSHNNFATEEYTCAKNTAKAPVESPYYTALTEKQSPDDNQVCSCICGSAVNCFVFLFPRQFSLSSAAPVPHLPKIEWRVASHWQNEQTHYMSTDHCMGEAGWTCRQCQAHCSSAWAYRQAAGPVQQSEPKQSTKCSHSRRQERQVRTFSRDTAALWPQPCLIIPLSHAKARLNKTIDGLKMLYGQV